MSISPSPILGQVLRAAGYLYSTWGIVSMPLTLDKDGFPKKPFVNGWPDLRLPWENLVELPWEGGVGLGIVLGPTSGNLCVVDVDDQELA
mgnify:FL=1